MLTWTATMRRRKYLPEHVDVPSRDALPDVIRTYHARYRQSDSSLECDLMTDQVNVYQLNGKWRELIAIYMP